MSEPRKATDVLLDLEAKVDALLGIIRAQDMNIKIIANKLNDITSKIDKQPIQQRSTAEAVQSIQSSILSQMPSADPERNIPIFADQKLPQEDAPKGFRRTSRPETYANEAPKLKQDVFQSPAEVVVKPPLPERVEAQKQSQGNIPVMQRCVDKNGKSIFLADIVIMDTATNQQVFKAKTSANGRWTAALSPGIYKVSIHKQGSTITDKIDAVQEVRIDGSKNQVELPMMIIK